MFHLAATDLIHKKKLISSGIYVKFLGVQVCFKKFEMFELVSAM